MAILKEESKDLGEEKVSFEDIVETIHEPVLVLTSDLRVEYANGSFFETFEVTPDETTGESVFALGDGQWEIPELRRLLEDVLPDDQVFENYEVAHDFEDIGPRVMLVNARRLDHVQYVLLGIRDITDQKRYTEGLLEAKEAAEEANREKTGFMATISHELRTPLNAIIGYTQLLLEGVHEALSKPVTRQVESIDRSARHLRHVLEEVLTFSRLERRGVRADVEEVVVQELWEETRAIIEHMVRGDEVRLELDVEDAPEVIRSDPGKLRQILLNLLGNAAKFTSEGEIGLRILDRDDTVRFEVWDTGPGIDPESQERLFEPFWQAEQADVMSGGGTGLGLTISRRYAEILGGELSVQSAAGEGSTFVLVLPKAHPGQPALGPRMSPWRAPRGRADRRSGSGERGLGSESG